MSFGAGIFIIIVSLIICAIICFLIFAAYLEKKDASLVWVMIIIGLVIIGGVGIGVINSCIQLKVTVIDKFISGGTSYVVVEDKSGEMRLLKEDEDWTSRKVGETIQITYGDLREALDEQTTTIIYSRKEASK